MRNGPSTEATIWKRMTDADLAPFKNVRPDPWPKVPRSLGSRVSEGSYGSRVNYSDQTVTIE
jgi:hypothetical protein